MDISPLKAVLLLAAAFAAGVVNSIAGGGTLLTFPALLSLGLDPKLANATSTVALWPGLLAGLWGYRRELDNSRTLLTRLGIISLLGGACGAWLLILTPSQTFARLVPFLILFATFLFMLQGTLSNRLRRTQGKATTTTEANRETKHLWWVFALILQFASAIYGGYFGAGNGILMLAIIGLLGVHDIHRANGIKNYLGLCLNSVAVLGFALSGLVYWPAALIMVLGAVAGGSFGANIAQRLPRILVRRAVVAIGLAIGLFMLWRTTHAG